MIAPKTLYLTDEDSNFEAETYWCEDKVGENDIKYIRADLVSQVKNLTDEEILEIAGENHGEYGNQLVHFARAILRKANEK
jgi:uncharacterized protein YbcI